MKEKITVVIKEPDKRPEIQEIVPELDTYHQIIDCDCIDVAYPFFSSGNIELKRAVCIIDDEGKLVYKPANFAIYDTDVIVGTAIFINSNEEGDEISLTSEQIEAIYKYLEDNSFYSDF